jgi:hypothetical protein
MTLRRHVFFAGRNLLSFTQNSMSGRWNEMARPHLGGGVPEVKTVCSSIRMRSTSCGWISGRWPSCLERVRDEPDACDERLTWSISIVVMLQRRKMSSAVFGSLTAANEI